MSDFTAAQDPSTSSDLLALLSNEGYSSNPVRYYVARNPSTPYGVWIILRDGYVRVFP